LERLTVRGLYNQQTHVLQPIEDLVDEQILDIHSHKIPYFQLNVEEADQYIEYHKSKIHNFLLNGAGVSRMKLVLYNYQNYLLKHPSLSQKSIPIWDNTYTIMMIYKIVLEQLLQVMELLKT
jgi:hypothetical protein